MDTSDFFAQSRAVQDRFVDAVSGRPPPQLLAYAALPDRSFVKLLAVSAVSVVLAVVLLAVGYASLTSRFALSPVWMAPVEAVLLGAAVLALALAIQSRRRDRHLPYRSGLYLFPGVLVVARGRQLGALPLDQLESARVEGARLVVAFSGHGSFSFKLADADAARRGPDVLAAHQRAVAEARRTGDTHALARLDPLIDPGIVSPLAPTVPLAAPAVARVPALVGAAVLGVAVGLGLWYARNRSSADALYAKARKQNSVAAYKQYLARGGKRPDVARVLLPRAELAEARSAHTVAALERFIREHAGSPVLSEAHAALKAFMVERVAKLSGVAHLTELRALAGDRHADLIKTEIRQAVLADYRSELSGYEKRATGASKAGQQCIRGLLDYASTHGPSVELGYVVHTADNSMADVAVRRSPYFPGSVALPSQYFDAAASEKRARKATGRFAALLQRAFPRDVLDFQLGKELDPTAAQDLSKLKRPTLVLDYSVLISGAYASARPPSVLVGLSMHVKTRCALPGKTAIAVASLAAWDPPTHDDLASGDPPGKIYDATLDKRFGIFSKKLLGALGLARP